MNTPDPAAPDAGLSRELETFPNPNPGREYLIDFECPEFTCVCPKTGQPDFATLRLQYIPGPSCLEMKSLKLYLWSFRNEGSFHEAVTNRILDELVAACEPKWMRVTGFFYVRGGMKPIITAEHPGPVSEKYPIRTNIHSL